MFDWFLCVGSVGCERVRECVFVVLFAIIISSNCEKCVISTDNCQHCCRIPVVFSKSKQWAICAQIREHANY